MEVCPNEETIEAFIGGRLDPRARQDVELHIDRCPSCAGVIARLMSHLPEQVTDPSVKLPPGETWTSPESRFRLPEGVKVGRFMILGGAGAGGMGTVYAAYDTALDRKIALKFLASASPDEAARARLFREATAMAKLAHPNVVTVYDVGVFQGQPYLAMELVDGVTLATWRRDRPRSAGEVATVMAAAGRGLAAAHAAGLIHRDVKPQNILIAGTRVLVTDFGLSVSERLGQEGGAGAVGTPGYMAPEQWAGGAVDARTDVFGLCATLYEMLTGVVPFEGSTLREVRDNVEAGKIAVRPAGVKVPARLERLALRGMARHPAERPPTVQVVIDELLADPGLRARRAVVAALGLAVVGGAFWGGGFLRGDPERRCLASAAVVDRAWNDERRGQMRARYAAAAKMHAWPVLERRLDEYAQGWRTKHAETCTATYGERRQSEQVLDLRMSCLETRRAALDAFVAGLATASAPQLVSAAGAPLPAVGECDLSGRGGTRPLPADPGVRAEIARIGDELGKAQAERLLGNWGRSAERAQAALRAARKVGYEPLLAQALDQTGWTINRLTGPEQPGSLASLGPGWRAGAEAKAPDAAAVPLLEEAVAVAERGGDDGRRAEAAINLVSVHVDADRYREAELWGRLAAGMLARMGDPVALRANLEHNVGYLHYRSDRREEAAAAFARAVALRTQALGPRHPDTVGSVFNTCITKRNPAETLACQRSTVALAEAAMGARHPLVAEMYALMSGPIVSDAPENRAQACAMLEKARAILADSVEPTSPALVKAISDLAYCLTQDRQWDRARAIHQEALALVAGLKGPSRTRAGVFQNWGLHLIYKGEYQAGVEQIRRSIADLEALLGPSHESVLSGWFNLSTTLREARRSAEALAAMNEVIPRCQRAAVTPAILPELLAERGEALRELGRFQEARRDFLAAIELHDRVATPPMDRHKAIYGLGAIHGHLDQPDEAVKYLTMARDLYPPGKVRPAVRAVATAALASAYAMRPPGERKACELLREALADLQGDGGSVDLQISQTKAMMTDIKCARFR